MFCVIGDYHGCIPNLMQKYEIFLVSSGGLLIFYAGLAIYYHQAYCRLLGVGNMLGIGLLSKLGFHAELIHINILNN